MATPVGPPPLPPRSTNPPTQSPIVVPILQAGGGTPSSAAAHHTIDTFNPPTLAHLLSLYKSLCAPSGISLDKSQTAHFLTDLQHDSAGDAGVGLLAKEHIGLDDFLIYMSSPSSSALAPPKHHDLSGPLSSYFISSSHNTYLTGNQLYSDASTEAYKNVLLRGCRCLEIDVWDGEERNWEDEKQQENRFRGDGRPAMHSMLSDKLDRLKAKATRSPSPRREKSSAEGSHLAAVNSETPQPWKSTVTGTRAEPRVLHGHTLTKQITFRAVCQAIAQSAFVATDLPIIISLEVHAGLEQQEIMVEIMKEAWRGMLVDITAQSETDADHLPSPDQLRRKILIKVKWTPNAKGGESDNPLEQAATNASSEEEGQLPNEVHEEKKKKAFKVLAALSQLGVYTRAYSFKDFSQPEARIPTHVFSLSEQKVRDMHESHRAALFDHNRDFLMRAFPSGLRVDSSNVDPSFLWRQGIQMAALNWQNWDKGMMLNEGMFAGEEGWVLKPAGYLGTASSGPRQGHEDCGPIPRQTLDLTIEIFAGQNIPSPIEEKRRGVFHPYVHCQLHVDHQTDDGTTTTSSAQKKDKHDEKYKRRSKTAKGNDPDFFGEAMHFSNVPGVVEKLSFLRVKVQDDRIGKDNLAAWACIRLDRLQHGIRFMHLLDASGMECSGVLLVRISKCIS